MSASRNPWLLATIRAFLASVAGFGVLIGTPGNEARGQANSENGQNERAAPAQSATDAISRVPGFWDPNRRFRKPVDDKAKAIRFITELESPPLSFTGPDGGIAGFNVEIARAICMTLEAQCTIQELKWDFLIRGISENRGDAIIAPVPINPETRKQFAFTQPFLGRPARFVTSRSARHQTLDAIRSETLRIAVIEDSPHARFLTDFFPKSEIKPFKTAGEAREALKTGAVEGLFGDGLTLSVWLQSAAADNCCRFVEGSFTEPSYFGEGIAIAVDADDPTLRDALDYALAEIYREGRYFEIFLRYFPNGFY